MMSSRAKVSAPLLPRATAPATVSAMAIRRTSRTSRQSPPTAAAATSSLLAAKETTEVDVGAQVHADGHQDHRGGDEDHGGRRSEEHTSELQSRENLVCRL